MKVQNFWKAVQLYTDTFYIILKLTFLKRLTVNERELFFFLAEASLTMHTTGSFFFFYEWKFEQELPSQLVPSVGGLKTTSNLTLL